MYKDSVYYFQTWTYTCCACFESTLALCAPLQSWLSCYAFTFACNPQCGRNDTANKTLFSIMYRYGEFLFWSFLVKCDHVLVKSWILLSLNWTELNQIELNWIKLNWTVSNQPEYPSTLTIPDSILGPSSSKASALSPELSYPVFIGSDSWSLLLIIVERLANCRDDKLYFYLLQNIGATYKLLSWLPTDNFLVVVGLILKSRSILAIDSKALHSLIFFFLVK